MIIYKNVYILVFDSIESFTLNFRDKFYDVDELKKEYQKSKFIFVLSLINYKSNYERLLENYFALLYHDRYNSIHKKYKIPIIITNDSNYVNVTEIISSKKRSQSIIIKKNKNNYDFFLNEFNIEIIPSLFMDCFTKENDKNILSNYNFYINKNILSVLTTYPSYLHNYLLLFQSFRENLNLRIVLDVDLKNNENLRLFYKISIYFFNFKDFIYQKINENFVKLKLPSFLKNINRVLPPFFINKETYNILKKPITQDNLNRIMSMETFEVKNNLENINYFLVCCKNYLYGDFKVSDSIIHSKIRKITFKSPMFKKMIKDVPVFALFIFSQYDFFYRESIQSEYKREISKRLELKESDFILNLQGNQTFENYHIYKKMLKNKKNIKSLIYWKSEENIITSIDKLVNGLHKVLYELINNNFNSFKENEHNILKINFPKIKNILFDLILNYINNILESQPEDLKLDNYSKLIINSISIKSSIIDEVETSNLYFKKNFFNTFELPKKISLSLLTFLSSLQTKKEFEEILSQIISNFKDIEISNEIIAELFEATVISEGLLQIVENAVKYANGGLLSLRIYDKEKEYLQHTYTDYFNTSQFLSDFYLEIILSDVSNNSITKTFIENIKNRIIDKESISVYDFMYKKFPKVIENLNVKSFFSPTLEEKEFWGEYYEISENQIHHYGLQIFESIINARKGIFIVEGHGEYFSNIKGLEENKKYFKGTSYRILLPLNHFSQKSSNVINEFSYIRDNSFFPPIDYSLKVIYIDELINEFNYDKEDAIKNIQIKLIERIDATSNYVCFVFNSKVDKKYDIEVLIKSILLFVFKRLNKKMYLSLINLTSQQLLESIRLISLYCHKRTSNSNRKNLQIFLRGINVGEEIVISGDNLNASAQRLIKTTLMRGTNFENIEIANRFLKESEISHE